MKAKDGPVIKGHLSCSKFTFSILTYIFASFVNYSEMLDLETIIVLLTMRCIMGASQVPADPRYETEQTEINQPCPFQANRYRSFVQGLGLVSFL